MSTQTVATRPQQALKKLEDFTPDKFNVLHPSQSIMDISPLQKLTFETVQINPDPKQKDVFKVGSKKEGETWVEELALTKKSLESISYAAGIIWDPHSTHRVDNGMNPRRVEFQATGAMQKPDGTWLVVTKTKEIDLDAIERETRANLESQDLYVGSGKDRKKLAPGSAEYKAAFERKVRDKMIQVEKFKVPLADTGAHNRVIRSILALKPNYTAEELKKPFVVPHIGLNTEFALADPELKKELISRAMGSAGAVFGGGHSLPEHRPTAHIPQSVQQSDAIVLEPEDDPETRTTEPEKPANPVTGEVRMSERDYKDQAAACSREERIAEIGRLTRAKNFTPKAGSKTPAELTDTQQVDYLWHLYSLPDVKQPTLPWE